MSGDANGATPGGVKPPPTAEAMSMAGAFAVRLATTGDGRLRVEAASRAGRATSVVPLPRVEIEPVDPADDQEPDPWREARRTGVQLHNALFAGAVGRLFDESRYVADDEPLPVALDVADPVLVALPWELLRDPDTDRFIALAVRSPFTRWTASGTPSPDRKRLPEIGALRVEVAARAVDEQAMALALAVGADARVSATVVPRGDEPPSTGAPWHVFQRLDGAPAADEVPAGTPLAVIRGDAAAAVAMVARVPAVVALPDGMADEAVVTFLAALYAQLGAGDAVDAAVTFARRAVVTAHALSSLSWAGPVLAVSTTPAPIVTPAAGRKVRSKLQREVTSRTVGWLSSTVQGVASSVAVFVLGLVLFRLGFSSSPELSFELVSPLSLYQSFKGLVLELSTYQEYILLIAGSALLLLSALVTYLWLRNRDRDPDEPVGWQTRFVGPFSSLRTISFLAVATLTVLGAYAYQQYLWRVLLPIPKGSLGIAITREAAAASFSGELADALFTKGQARKVVVRELPVAFDARDTEKARKLGKRLGAEAVLIYRADTTAGTASPRYVAYVVFTDPDIGVRIGGAPSDAASDAATSATTAGMVDVKAGVRVPALRTATLDGLVSSAAGIISYQDDRFRDAIKQLELAVPSDQTDPNTGIVNFYLGSAYRLDGQDVPAAAAYERSIEFYEGQRSAGTRLGPQDELALVDTYLFRGTIAALADKPDDAIGWYQRGADLREDLLSRAGGLERPADVHATYAWLYGRLADAYRFKQKDEEQGFWRKRAGEELDALAALSDPKDGHALVQQAATRVFIGDCAGAVAALDRGLELDPTDLDALNDAAIVAFFQDRPDRAGDYWHQVVRLQPDDINARQLIANVLTSRGIGGDYFEPSYLLEAEQVLRDVLALDPANLAVHKNLAQSALLRGDAQHIDSTALATGNELVTEKSQALWRRDPTRRKAAVDAYSATIEQRRILAEELQPGNMAAAVDLATAYEVRQDLLYSLLLYGAIEPGDTQLQPTGEQILADASQIQEWTTRVLAASSGAGRTERLQAWAAQTASLQRGLTWYTLFAPDVDRAAAAKVAYRQAVDASATFVDQAKATNPDESMAMGQIYQQVAYVKIDDGDSTGASTAMATASRLMTENLGGRQQSTQHLDTYCAEVQEKEAGNDLLLEGNLAGARSHYETALKLNPDYSDAASNLALTFYQQGDLANAVARAQDATTIDPSDASLWRGLALYHLAGGSAPDRDAAYERFFALIAKQPPQEQMANVRSAIADLQGLIEKNPELASQVLEVLPRFTAALDAMERAEVTRTFQYPELYTALGAVALDAGSGQAAEPLLRRAIALDPHQPTARVDLVLARIARDQDASEAIGAAIAETRDPLWQETITFPPTALLDEMTAAIDRFGERFPDRDARLAPVREAITAEQRALDQAAT